MITLKLKSYNRLELEKLRDLIGDYIDTITRQRYCLIGNQCKICEYHHLCNDLYAALQYVEDKLQIR